MQQTQMLTEKQENQLILEDWLKKSKLMESDELDNMCSQYKGTQFPLSSDQNF